jgi:hypothetical protein
MSRNGSGTYNLPAGNPVVTGTTISSAWANTTLTDIANSLTQSIAADGQTPVTGNIAMGSNKLTGLGVGTTTGDSVEYSQLVALLNNAILTGTVSMTGTGFLLIPKGTTAERPVSPVAGEIRYNTTISSFEGYSNGAWGQLGGGATGGGGDQVFVENGVTVTTNYTLSTSKNAESVGPITINSGITVTVPATQRWVIL